MISIGGNHEPDSWETWTDPWPNGLGIFDLSGLNWTDAYDHTAAPYERSSLVASYYSNNTRYPRLWADPALQAIFEANTPSIPTIPSPTSSPSPEQGSIGAIAGGVVGGVAALAIIGGVILWCLRNERRSSRGGVQTQGPTYLSDPVEMDLNPTTKAVLHI
jgi:hypothetical protein